MKTITQDTIDSIKGFGFKVYQRKDSDSWVYYTLNDSIAYLENAYFGGFNISSVHIPNVSTGSGYQIKRDVVLDKWNLMQGFSGPSWTNCRSNPFKDMDSFINSCAFNNSYREIL